MRARYFRIANLNVEGKLKYERFNHLVKQANLKLGTRSFLGLSQQSRLRHRPSDRLALYPKWKSMYERERLLRWPVWISNETDGELFLLGQYAVLPQTLLDFGVEFSLSRTDRASSRGVAELCR